MRVWPTRAHSVRIWRVVASVADTVTRPSAIVMRTWAEAEVPASAMAATMRPRTCSRMASVYGYCPRKNSTTSCRIESSVWRGS